MIFCHLIFWQCLSIKPHGWKFAQCVSMFTACSIGKLTLLVSRNFRLKCLNVSAVKPSPLSTLACSSVLAGVGEGGKERKHSRRGRKEERGSLKTAREKHRDRKQEKTWGGSSGWEESHIRGKMSFSIPHHRVQCVCADTWMKCSGNMLKVCSFYYQPPFVCCVFQHSAYHC